MKKLFLLGTSGCHLCEDAAKLLANFANIDLEVHDIMDNEDWQEKYAIRIPVLYDPSSQTELGWRFDVNDITNFIAGLE